MSRSSSWATKVASLLQGGNTAAAIEQIKVAPTVKDLQQLRALLSAAKARAPYQNVEQAIADQIVNLSSSRLHRSP